MGWFLLALQHAINRDIDDAMDFCDHANSLGPENPTVILLMALLLTAQQRVRVFFLVKAPGAGAEKRKNFQFFQKIGKKFDFKFFIFYFKFFFPRPNGIWPKGRNAPPLPLPRFRIRFRLIRRRLSLDLGLNKN